MSNTTSFTFVATNKLIWIFENLVLLPVGYERMSSAGAKNPSIFYVVFMFFVWSKNFD